MPLLAFSQMIRGLPLLFAGTLAACTPAVVPPIVWDCQMQPGTEVSSLPRIGCATDWSALAVRPLDASIPGAFTVKTGIDRSDGDALYFQDTEAYPIHWDFASAHRSGGGLPPVPELATFNGREYYAPDRRFVLGAVSYYEGPGAWVYEVAPYDNAGAELISLAFTSIQANTYFGPSLAFHPTSTSVAAVAEDLPPEIPVVSTDELFLGIDYQPLNLGESTGRLVFHEVAALDPSAVHYRDLVVLDHAPIDLPVCAGVISEEFQTPLSHINVLARNRGTPNMGLRGAMGDPVLRALEGLWVRLAVEADRFVIEEISAAEAEAWWAVHRPDPLQIEAMDTSVTDLIDAEQILDLDGSSLGDALHAAIAWAGGKASHMGGLARIGDTVRSPDSFVIPMSHYDGQMTRSGAWDALDNLLADPDAQGDPALRAARIAEIADLVRSEPMDPALLLSLVGKIQSEQGMSRRMRFRSSTNSEDLGQFTGAGLYTSTSADSGDDAAIEAAVLEVWASPWTFRSFEERAYWGLDHHAVGMAVMVHPAFPQEEANGVAVTNNPFDPSGSEPAFYVNAQRGDISVVQPPPGIVADQFLHYADYPGAPVVYLGHSNLVPGGQAVLTAEEIDLLASQLRAIHQFFLPAYGSLGGWYAMDTEWKVERGLNGPEIWVKQARPYPMTQGAR